MTQYKTILAPNAPWPVFEAPKGRVRNRTNPEYLEKYRIKKKLVRSKQRATDDKFEQWLNSLEKVKK
jgi:hypothetical protein